MNGNTIYSPRTPGTRALKNSAPVIETSRGPTSNNMTRYVSVWTPRTGNRFLNSACFTPGSDAARPPSAR
jgi:hypothetical protein